MGFWSSKRDFLHVADLGLAVKHFMLLSQRKFSQAIKNETHLNIGSGNEISIRNLSQMIARLTGFKGTIKFDANMPDGTMRKLLSVDLAKKCGWAQKLILKKG